MECPIAEICRTWTDDCQVVRCIQEHSSANAMCYGYELIASRYRRQLLNLAYQKVGNWDDAEDVVQDTILRAMHGIDTFRCECSVNTWLWRIVARTASNFHRAKQVRAAESLFSDVEDPDRHHGCSVCDSADPNAPSIQELIVSAEEQQSLRNAMSDLPESMRILLEDHYLKGEPWKEMAARLDMDEKTLRLRRRRAEALLRGMLIQSGWTAEAEPVMA